MIDRPAASLTVGQRVEVDAAGSLYDRVRGTVIDIDHAGIVEVRFDNPAVVGELRNLFTAGELAPEGRGRPFTRLERLERWLGRWL